jgi:hypothetical protein
MTWTDEGVFRPLDRFAKLADKHFAVGETISLVEHHDRSMNSHRQFFASLHEAWDNLPEDQAERFATSEHLRKWALIRAGYSDERSIVCASKAEALRLAAFIKPIDEYAVVVANEAVVRVFTAQSQSMKAMGAKAFQDSKQKVLDIAWGLCGVEPEEHQRNAGRAAA